VGSWVALGVVFSGLWLGNPAEVEAATVPTSLSGGEQYRLVFVTSNLHKALSSDISTYNKIVDDLGDPILDSDWKVIGSTATVDAIVNTDTPIDKLNVSIWRLDDVKVADNYADLWDGVLDAAINKDQDGATPTPENRVWTGRNHDGVKAADPLGDSSSERVT
jgi:hypothetical protein